MANDLKIMSSPEMFPPPPVLKKDYLKSFDKFIGSHRGTISLLCGMAPYMLYFTPIGVISSAGKIALVATTVATVSLKVFEEAKPQSKAQIATLNLMHHFICISLPFISGSLTAAYLHSYVAKNQLFGLTLLASWVYVAANYIFPPINYKSIYKRLGIY
jgi:hypothetical protein